MAKKQKSKSFKWDHWIIKQIAGYELLRQGLEDDKASILAEEAPSFRMQLEALEGFVREQEYSPLLNGCKKVDLTQEQKEQILLNSAPDGEWRIVHFVNPILGPSRLGKDLEPGVYLANCSNPGCIYWLPILQDEYFAVVGQFELFDLEIIRIGKEITNWERKLEDWRTLQGDPQKVVSAEAIGESDNEKISAPAAIKGSGDLEKEKTATNGAKELDSAEQPATVEGIKILLEECKGVIDKETLEKKRKRVVELWQQKQKEAKKISTKIALYTQAGKARKEFYAWSSGKRPDGSAADRDIRLALTSDWD